MKKQLLTLNNCHVFISGMTRSGKTYFAAEAVRRLSAPAIFLNLQDEELGAPFIDFGPADYVEDVKRQLHKGRKIDFRYGYMSMDKIQLVNAVLINRLMQDPYFNQERPVYVVIDEAQTLSGAGLDQAIAAATRGLSKGVRLICITQRPALVNKTLYTQSMEQYIFRLAPSESQYFKNKGVDYDKCRAEWERLGDHSYIFTDGFTIEGRKAI